MSNRCWERMWKVSWNIQHLFNRKLNVNFFSHFLNIFLPGYQGRRQGWLLRRICSSCRSKVKHMKYELEKYILYIYIVGKDNVKSPWGDAGHPLHSSSVPELQFDFPIKINFIFSLSHWTCLLFCIFYIFCIFSNLSAPILKFLPKWSRPIVDFLFISAHYKYPFMLHFVIIF